MCLKKIFLPVFLMMSLLVCAQSSSGGKYILTTTRTIVEKDLTPLGLQIIDPLLSLENIYIVGPIQDAHFNLDNVASLYWVSHIAKEKQLEPRTLEPDDTNYPDQWHLPHIHAPEFWEMNTGGLTHRGDTIVIAIIDQGFDISHEDFEGNIWHNKDEIPNDGMDNDNNGFIDDINGWNFSTNSPDLELDIHGNYVFGALGAKGNNAKGISGVNWDVKTMLFSISSDVEIVQAYEYIRAQRIKYNQTNGEEGAFIISTNLSLGLGNQFAEDYPEWCEMYNLLGEVGILNVGATTNSSINIDSLGDMPSTCTSPYLLVITNSTIDDMKGSAGFSKTHVDFAAPGVSIQTTGLANQYKNVSGTSLSSPLVTGAIALLATIPSDTLNGLFTNNPNQAALLLKESIISGLTETLDLAAFTKHGGRLDLWGAFEGFKEALGTNQRNAQLDIVPNPTSDKLYVNYVLSSGATSYIDIYDLAGKSLLSVELIPQDLEYNQETIDVSGLTSGLYIITLTNAKDVVSTKFVKHN